jgi:hemerythrin-like domain-containing protein
MLPLIDLKGEHTAMTIILHAMKKLVYEIRRKNDADLFRVSQIAGFLHIYTDLCHYEKEEKGLFPVLLESNKSWVVKTIHQLVNEHSITRGYIKEIGEKLNGYLSGQNMTLRSISESLSGFITLEEHHMKIEDTIVLPLCDRLLDQDKLMRIASLFHSIQDQYVSHFKHLEYNRLLSQLYFENKEILH